VPINLLSSHFQKPRLRDRRVSESPQRGQATLRRDPSQTPPVGELMDASCISRSSPCNDRAVRNHCKRPEAVSLPLPEARVVVRIQTKPMSLDT
jgi:hypothetical protein